MAEAWAAAGTLRLTALPTLPAEHTPELERWRALVLPFTGGPAVMVRGSAASVFVAVMTLALTACATSGSAPTERDRFNTFWTQYRQTPSTINAECNEQMTHAAELDPIRSKVELYRTTWDAPPPFTMAANTAYPTQVEREAIAKWASMRDACITRQRAVSRVPPIATPMQATFIQQDFAFFDEVTGKVSALIVALYQGKLTYGEFAQKRYEFGRDGDAAEREFRQATLIADQQRAVQAQQLAQQNFQNTLAAWSTYVQAVNSRPPQIHVEQNVTVH